MASSGLLTVCISAFIAVFILLSILALVMRFILCIFPVKDGGTDAAVMAAISTTYNTIYPETTIKKIEEEK